MKEKDETPYWAKEADPDLNSEARLTIIKNEDDFCFVEKWLEHDERVVSVAKIMVNTIQNPTVMSSGGRE